MSLQEGQIMYRAVADVIVYADTRAPSVDLSYERYIVRKVTPKGGWVERFFDGKSLEPVGSNPADMGMRFVLERGRWCSTTKEEAYQRLRARSRSYLKHCRRRLRAAEAKAAFLDVNPEPPERIWLKTGKW